MCTILFIVKLCKSSCLTVYWLPRIHIPLFRLNYINTGELVMAQFTIPEHIHETNTDEVVAGSNKQLELYWKEFLDR